ncbi:MAG: nicotinamide mononucleotide deamidase-related protein [Thermoplasmatales archaeon]|nr:nicotinamide mononucleotide deamidase-related protein [Thermoplasmatales archaeon]MCW6170226.1 nicotinamide mononucleotide deamidase-related protein [Thermoplasmatales archaeon]
MRASIITIGNEILKGKTVNTNFAYIGSALTNAGYDVWRGIIVRDIADEIGFALKIALDSSDLIVTSGGLGPTYDDMTLLSIANALSLSLVLNEEALEMIKDKYKNLNIPITDQRRKMAMLPEGSYPLPNPVGTAPGVFISYNNKAIVCLPGVPAEMKGILDLAMDKLKSSGKSYVEKTVRLRGIMESAIAPLIEEEMKLWGNKVYIKSHPGSIEVSNPYLDIEVSSHLDSREEAEKDVDSVLNEIISKYKSYIGK